MKARRYLPNGKLCLWNVKTIEAVHEGQYSNLIDHWADTSLHLLLQEFSTDQNLLKVSRQMPHHIFFKRWANPGLFFVNFRHFKQSKQFLQQTNVKKCPSSSQHRDSNSKPLKHELSPITTRPGLPPQLPHILQYEWANYFFFVGTCAIYIWKSFKVIGPRLKQCNSIFILIGNQ